MLRFHYHPYSTYARRVWIALLEKGIQFEPVTVDMVARAHRAPEYLALNPYGRVPTIDDDGFVLYESAAILQYLEATRPAPPLTPPDQRGRARVDMHVRLCDLQMARPTVAIIFPKRFLPRERWDLDTIAKSRTEVVIHLETLERELGEREFLVEETFSLADVAYLPFLQFLQLMEIEPPPRVSAWAQRLLARPSAAATIPER